MLTFTKLPDEPTNPEHLAAKASHDAAERAAAIYHQGIAFSAGIARQFTAALPAGITAEEALRRLTDTLDNLAAAKG